MKWLKPIIIIMGVLIIIFVGRVVGKDKFSELKNYKTDCAIVSVDNVYYGVLDSAGNWLIQPNYFMKINKFRNGIAAASVDGYSYGYIDINGSWVIEPNPEYVEAKPFTDKDKAIVLDSLGREQKIDRRGNVVIPFQEPTMYISRYSNNLTALLISEVEKTDTSDITAEIENMDVQEMADQMIEDVRYRITNSRAYNRFIIRDYIDSIAEYSVDKAKELEQVVMEQLSVMGDFSVSVSYGFGDPVGRTVIEPTFDYAEPFADNGLALVKTGDYCGYINNEGDYLIAPSYPDAKSFGNFDLAPVFNGNKWGYINSQNQLVIDFVYDNAYPFTDNGLALVSIMDGNGFERFGYIDSYGQVVIGIEFLDATEFFSVS